MSSLPAEPGEMLTKNAAAKPESAANCRVLQFDVAAIAERYRPFLKAIAAAEFPDHLQSRIDDSDLIQETLLRAAQHADQFLGTTELELKGWLRETLLNQIKDFVRFNGRQQRDVKAEFAVSMSEVAASDSTVSEELQKAESRELIWRTVNDLPEVYRTVMLLRQQKNMSFPEIAEQMERSPDAVRMLWCGQSWYLGRS